MPSPIPPPALFVREDTAKAENRVNLALFGLMLIPHVRAWFLEQLQLQPDSTVYPPQNTAGGRPDLVVVSPDNRVVAWIEIELGAEDTGQLASYRAMLAEPVISIVGPAKAIRSAKSGGYLSLETIAQALNADLALTLDAQQAINAGVFTRLVAGLTHAATQEDYTDPDVAIRARSLLQHLEAQLGNMLRYGTPPIAPGTAQVATITQKGWTVRVFSKAARMRSVSVLWDPAVGKGQIRVPSRERLARCLPTALDAVDAYVALLAELGANVRLLSEVQSLALPEDTLLAEGARLAVCIRALALAYGGAVPGSAPPLAAGGS